MNKEAWWATVHGVKKVRHDYSDLTRAAADMQTTPPSWQKVKN